MNEDQTTPAMSDLVRQLTKEPDLPVDHPKDLLLFSVIIFVIAALLPAASIGSSGRRTFIWGWFCIAFPFSPAWLANPFLWLSWICGYFQHWRVVCVSCVIALLLSLLALLAVRGGKPPYDPSLQVGYFFWIFSMLLALASGIVGVTQRKDRAAGKRQ